MSRLRLTVVVSQAPGKHPDRRALEEAIVTSLFGDPRYEVSVIPHLYDLDADHPARLFLQSVRGDLVVLAWLYPRASFWVLDRNGVRGRWGETRLPPPTSDEAEEASTDGYSSGSSDPSPRADKLRPPPPERYIYCLDLRDAEQAESFVAEIHRIYTEVLRRWEEQHHFATPLVELGLRVRPHQENETRTNGEPSAVHFRPEELLRPAQRRWYPVIDYSRCTNCLECLNFCLFGVYSVTEDGLIYVEHQDECRKGCPACSRVCPEHAIVFPEYKSPAIAGANVGGVEALKIDLSKLFGGADAIKIAAAERDRELIAAGRQAVGMTVGIPKRQANKPDLPKDDLDKLLDQLDAAEL